MAETSYIIQNGKRLNLKDAAARSSIGSCDELKTGVKHCLVHAINELAEKLENGFVVNSDFSDDSKGIRVNNADIVAVNASVAVGDLFFNSSSLNAGNLYMEGEEGKVYLSANGLVFEDWGGNKKSLGGIDYIEEADPNAVMFSEMEEYVEEAIEGVKIETDNHTIIYNEDGKLTVNTADEVGDNTLPITAAAVNTTVGNIEVLLKTI